MKVVAVKECATSDALDFAMMAVPIFGVGLVFVILLILIVKAVVR